MPKSISGEKQQSAVQLNAHRVSRSRGSLSAQPDCSGSWEFIQPSQPCYPVKKKIKICCTLESAAVCKLRPLIPPEDWCGKETQCTLFLLWVSVSERGREIKTFQIMICLKSTKTVFKTCTQRVMKASKGKKDGYK